MDNEHLAELIEGFPLVTIRADQIHGRTLQDTWRVSDDIKVSGIDGCRWISITPRQARGTEDMLAYVEPRYIPIFLPGYVQHLIDMEEADCMLDSLPAFIIRLLRNSPESLNKDQRKSIAQFFRHCISRNAAQMTRRELKLFERVIALCGQGPRHLPVTTDCA